MSLSMYIKNMAQNYQITPKPDVLMPMIPKTVQRIASMMQETDASEIMCEIMELLGVLTYIAMTCRPDIQYAAPYLARFAAEPTNLVYVELFNGYAISFY